MAGTVNSSRAKDLVVTWLSDLRKVTASLAKLGESNLLRAIGAEPRTGWIWVAAATTAYVLAFVGFQPGP